MRLSISILGAEVFAISTEPEEVDDKARDLSGGNLSSESIDAGHTDWTMGFTNGRECGDDDSC